MDATTRRELTKELESAAKKIAEAHGFTAIYKGGSYDSATFMIRIEFADAKQKKVQSQGFARIVGLSEDIIGTSFRHKTKTFTVTALDPSKPKNCVILKDQNGRGFKCSVAQYKMLSAKS
jgi:hypothetical protein